MVDSCRLLTVSQSNGDEDTAGMVTILTGHQVEELCTQSAAMKVSQLLQSVILQTNKHSSLQQNLMHFFTAALSSVHSTLSLWGIIF